jgi:hypothetical protein
MNDMQFKERAAYYLRTARMFRESGRTGMVRVWEEEKVEFVGAESLIAFVFVLIFTPHELCRRAIGQAR